MRRCPQCGQIYSDDLIYCLQDGSSLLGASEAEETPTAVRPPRPNVIVRRKRPVAKYLALGLLALLGVAAAGAVGAYFVWSSLGKPQNQETATADPTTPTPRRSPVIQTTPTATPKEDEKDQNGRLADQQRERERLAEERREQNDLEAEDQDVDSEPAFSDPGAARIRFRRGRVSETVSGRINRSRSFVLYTLSGQNLSASVRSDRNCVVLENGASSMSFTTSIGDSRVSVKNNCPRPARFDLTVTVR